jgi:hypothetical protein
MSIEAKGPDIFVAVGQFSVGKMRRVSIRTHVFELDDETPAQTRAAVGDSINTSSKNASPSSWRAGAIKQRSLTRAEAEKAATKLMR